MAKKITINGTNLLDSLSDDWGGVNNTQSPISVHGTTVPAGAEWGINRGEVERFIKEQFGEKCGSACFSPSPNTSNHYELWGFATAADQTEYLTELAGLSPGEELPPTIAALRLFTAELPIAATSTDTYTLNLSTSRTGSTQANPIIAKRGADFEVPLRVFAWHYPPQGSGEPCNYNIQPQIIIERSTNGSTWTQVGSFGVTGIAESESDNTYPNVVNVGKMADTGSDGTVMIRFSIPSYVYTNAAGETAIMASNRVVVYLRTVTLGISMSSTDWLAPIRPADSDTSISVKFNLQGAVAKTLHVKFTNAAGVETYDVTTQNVTATGSYDYTIRDDSGNLGVATSGVHTLTAWLTVGSGADMIETEPIVHQLLVLKPSTASTVGMKVLVQEMATKVDNFVQSVLCHYWVWKPKLEGGIYINDTSQNVPVRFIVADSPNLSEEHVEYVTIPVSVQPGTDCTLLATMEVETVVVQDTYTARLHALASDSTALLTPPRQFLIDNTAGFQPVSGTVWHLNPKARNNDEPSPKTIINAVNGSTVQSVWSSNFKMDNSDGWVQDDTGEKVLRVPAGRKLEVLFNPFNHFYTAPSPSKALCIDIDFQINNITNEDDPILRLCESSGTAGEYLGLRMRPLVGTMGSVTASDESITGFRWAEGRRQHLSITITPGVAPNVDDDARYTPEYAADAHGTINLVRVYLNGVIERETRYNPSNRSEFCTGALSNGGLIFGQEGAEGRSSGADIDIYDIRIWELALNPKQVNQNTISALPGSDEKRRIKEQNDITMDNGSGRISLAKACSIGKNCLIWHGVEVMYGDDSKKGWLEMRRYDYNGNHLPQYSGSFCKATKKLKGKGQGTTAMTYFYWNTQWKFGDIGYDDDGKLDPSTCIVITPSQVESNVHLGTPVLMSSLSASDQAIFENVDPSFDYVCPVYGGNLGADEPVGTKTKYYPCTVDGNSAVATIMFPDGWVNGSGDLVSELNPTGGKYCGACWQAGANLPYGSKHVLKINYASSMQSHLIGVTWLYNALHTAYCGNNSLQRDTPTAVVAKQTVPVLFFTAGVDVVDADETDGTANFRGLGAFGPGKMDKPSWGYNKKASKITDPTSDHYRPDGHDYFAMFEGAVNNSVLSDQIAPWDDTDHLDANGNVIQRAKVKYFLQDPVNPGVAKDPECFFYRHTVIQDGQEVDSWEKGIGFDGGKTGRTVADGLLYNSNSCDNPEEAPSAKITGILRNAWNYVYLHNPNVRYYNGTQDQLAAATENMTEAQRKRKYITRDNFLLKRYDFCERRWVDAGLWNTSTHAYDQIDIADVIGASPELRDDRQAVVDAYITYLVNEARPSNSEETNGIGAFFKAKSLRFHYAFENHFIAGTDNCSKNTYYVIDPVTHLIELHQDDVDTTIATDNYGFQTKPYYVDRMNPYDDKDTVRAENQSCYDGMLNTLFDLTEWMWARNGNDTISNAVGSIFSLMLQLTGGIGSPESDAANGVWKTIGRYLFDIQRYFPHVAYNETARIRYEFPAMLGFIGRSGEADPLAQSMGDQLEAEIQFMTRRLVYMASYAGFGEFSNSQDMTGSTGLPDASATLAVNSVTLPNGAVPGQTFTLVPHQYLFPVFSWQRSTQKTLHRTAPGESYTYTTTFQFSNGYPIELRGLNYYRSVGNLGDKTINPTSFQIQGSRLTEFIAEPTTYYSTTQGGGSITREQYEALTPEQKSNYAPAFSRSSNLQIAAGNNGATRLSTISLNGCVNTGSSLQIPFDLSRLTLLQNADFRKTSMQSIIIPETSTLTTLHLPSTLASLSLTNQPNLATLDFEGVANLTRLEIINSPLLMGSISMLILDAMRQADAPTTNISLRGLEWTGVQVSLIRYLINIGNRGTCLLYGSITLPTGQVLSYEDVSNLMSRYGNIRSSENDLYVNYPTQSIGADNIGIGGRKYIVPSWLGTLPAYWEPTAIHPDAGLWLTVAYGNNVLAAQRPDGSWGPSVTWRLIGTDDTNYADFDIQKPAGQNYAFSPRLHIFSLYAGKEITVRVTIQTTTATLTYDKKVGLWNRVPEVGDFAWVDGTFDKEDDPSKLLAGTVVMREPLERDPVTNDITKARIWVLGIGNASLPSSTFGGQGGSANIPACVNDSGQQSMTSAWGLYPSTEAFGMPDAKDAQNIYTDDIMKMVQDYLCDQATQTERAYTRATDIFDTALPNVSTDFTISPSTYQNQSNVSPIQGRVDSADGQSRLTNQPVGDGTGYAQRSSDGSQAVEDFSTIMNNEQILIFANNITRALVAGLSIDSGSLPSGVDPQTYEPKTLQGLADLTLLIQRYIAAKYQSTEGSPVSPADAALDWTNGNGKSLAVFRELMYLPFRLCHCWSPSDTSGTGITEEMLHEQYKKGNWKLPSNGLLARIFNFLYNSSCTKTVDPTTGAITYGSRANSATVKRENNNENDTFEIKEAQLALFSNILERSNGRRTISLSAGSYHWSSSEYYRNLGRIVNFSNGYAYFYNKYNSLVVRPVAAFTFEA